MMFGLNLDREVSENYTSLHSKKCTESSEDIQEMVKILQEDPESLERRQMPFLSSPLRDAASRGHVECIKFLLEQGANVECEDRRGSTPLNAAVQIGNVECVRVLLQSSADPNHTSEFNPSLCKTACLTKACMNGTLDIVKLLLEHGAVTEDLPDNAEDFLLTTPASTAVVYGHSDILLVLLLYGAVIDLSTLTNFAARPNLVAKHSLLQLCVLHQQRHEPSVTKEILNLLRQFGANFNQKDSEGLTALQVSRDKDFDINITTEILQYYSSHPLSLKEISRLQIIKYLKPNYLNVVKNLELPKELLHYLHFNNTI